jgi:hypothetical protein
MFRHRNLTGAGMFKILNSKFRSVALNALATLVALSLISSTGQSLTDGARKLVHFETQANAAATRSEVAMRLPHLEIPVSMVGIDFANRLNSQIADSLIFEKYGEKYVRWILNPEDTVWGEAVINHFSSKGLSLTRKYYYIGYQTASRSYIAEDPITHSQFSVKSSTNITGGFWRDKKQPIGEAVDGRLLSDFLHEQNRRLPFKSFVVMDEPAIMSVSELDQAVVIRDIGSLNEIEGKVVYLPGFSALHETVGAKIALANGSGDPFAFWTEHYVKVAGKALGELAARTGIQFDSPHSQNFLIELNGQMRPTGRLVLRDMSDLYLDKSFVKAIQGRDSKLLQDFNQRENIKGEIVAGFGPLHGNKKPSWVNEAQYSTWQSIFFNQFEESFEAVSGYRLQDVGAKKYQSGDYFGANYDLSSNSKFKTLFQMLNADGYVRNLGGAVTCEKVFSQAAGF